MFSVHVIKNREILEIVSNLKSDLEVNEFIKNYPGSYRDGFDFKVYKNGSRYYNF